VLDVGFSQLSETSDIVSTVTDVNMFVSYYQCRFSFNLSFCYFCYVQTVRPMLDNPNLPVHDGTYFDCLESVTERAKVISLTFFIYIKELTSWEAQFMHADFIIVITVANYSCFKHKPRVSFVHFSCFYSQELFLSVLMFHLYVFCWQF